MNNNYEMIIKSIVNFKLETEKSPRKIMLDIFSEPIAYEINIYNNQAGYEMPISGGYGYSMEDAVVIDKYDLVVDQKIPFDGVELEYIFARYRAYLEMITFRNKNERFMGIKLNLEKQELFRNATGVYDKLVFNISAFYEKDLNKLEEEWKSKYKSSKSDENLEEKNAHFSKIEEKRIHLQKAYWFEISSFFEQGLVVKDNKTGQKKLLKKGSNELEEYLKEFALKKLNAT